MITQLKMNMLSLAVMLLFAVGSVHASEIVANPDNGAVVDKELLKLILTGREKFWESGSEVVIVMLKSDPDAAAALTEYSGMTSNKFKNHWQRIVFSGRGKMPKMFSNLEDAVQFIQEHEGAIGIISSKADVKSLRRIDLGVFTATELKVELLAISR